MGENSFYPDNEQYNDITFYDEQGKPISPHKARRLLTGFAIACFAGAAVLLTILIVILNSHGKMYDRCTVEVVGVVADNIKNGTEKDSAVFPVFRYEYKGRTYKVKSDSPAAYSIGEYRTIHINPDDPSEYYIDKDDSTAVAALSVLSGAFAVLGIMLVIVIVKSKRNAAI